MGLADSLRSQVAVATEDLGRVQCVYKAYMRWVKEVVDEKMNESEMT